MAQWCDKCINCNKHGALVNYGIVFACDEPECNYEPIPTSYTTTSTSTNCDGAAVLTTASTLPNVK